MHTKTRYRKFFNWYPPKFSKCLNHMWIYSLCQTLFDHGGCQSGTLTFFEIGYSPANTLTCWVSLILFVFILSWVSTSCQVMIMMRRKVLVCVCCLFAWFPLGRLWLRWRQTDKPWRSSLPLFRSHFSCWDLTLSVFFLTMGGAKGGGVITKCWSIILDDHWSKRSLGLRCPVLYLSQMILLSFVVTVVIF